MTKVIDASAFVELLIGDVHRSDHPALDDELEAPDLFLVEVTSGLRRSEKRGRIGGALVARLVQETLVAPIALTPARSLIERAFELRHNLTISDGCYVALAEQLGCSVLTADERLARAPGITVPITVV